LVKRAEDAEKLRQYDRARQLYQQAERAAKDAPSRAFAARALGKALIFWGQYPDAAAALGRAVAAQPSQVESWHDLGVVNVQLNRETEAERAFKTSIRLLPGAPYSRLALAALLVNQRRFGEAIAQYEQLKRQRLPKNYRDAIARALKLLRSEMQAQP